MSNLNGTTRYTSCPKCACEMVKIEDEYHCKNCQFIRDMDDFGVVETD